MSDELIENDTPLTPVTKPKPNPASIIAILLILGVIGFSGYVYSFWFTHNSRTARLKARNGDFVQLQRRSGDDEFAATPPRNGNGRNDNDSESKEDDSSEGSKASKNEPNAVEKFVKDLMPLPIQIVYWKEPKLQAEDIDLILEFQDLEILSVKCDQIDAKTIERFLNLPRIRRINIQSNSIDTKGIESWVANDKFANLKFINTKWSDEDMRNVQDQAKENLTLKRKLTLTSSAAPAFGGM
ncbi:MAG: hypothetical protein WCI02_11365 [Planctomycetota bacterium]